MTHGSAVRYELLIVSYSHMTHAHKDTLISMHTHTHTHTYTSTYTDIHTHTHTHTPHVTQTQDSVSSWHNLSLGKEVPVASVTGRAWVMYGQPQQLLMEQFQRVLAPSGLYRRGSQRDREGC